MMIIRHQLLKSRNYRVLLRFNSSNANNSPIDDLRKQISENIREKYLSKLQEKAKAEGLSINELRDKFKDQINKVKSELDAIDPNEQIRKIKEEKAIVKDRGKIDKTKDQAPYKTLDDFVALDKVKDLPKDEISKIWSARFINKERALHAVTDNYQFAQIYANAFRYPNFLLPIPKKHEGKEGFELQFIQWSFVGPLTIHCMFTTLAEYKLHNEYAKPHTTLTFHQELAKDKDIVLMNGLSEKDCGLTMQEAQFLVINLQRFYSGKEPEKLAIVKSFNLGEGFNVDDLIAQSMSS
ncbi:unnamed protein product [Candida verbasci]|uniref:Uncharacterized protein n=1 Tax=Candida verbasci TaxID=1227364 RepID=A0A9W4XF65_9ASCO|nr:unnamed protein product [Candida verbasci]